MLLLLAAIAFDDWLLNYWDDWILEKAIELRLSQLSANEEIFKNSIKPYNEALAKAGCKYELRYQQNIRQNTTTINNRKGKIIWFNPPYS